MLRLEERLKDQKRGLSAAFGRHDPAGESGRERAKGLLWEDTAPFTWRSRCGLCGGARASAGAWRGCACGLPLRALCSLRRGRSSRQASRREGIVELVVDVSGTTNTADVAPTRLVAMEQSAHLRHMALVLAVTGISVPELALGPRAHRSGPQRHLPAIPGDRQRSNIHRHGGPDDWAAIGSRHLHHPESRRLRAGTGRAERLLPDADGPQHRLDAASHGLDRTAFRIGRQRLLPGARHPEPLSREGIANRRQLHDRGDVHADAAREKLRDHHGAPEPAQGPTRERWSR